MPIYQVVLNHIWLSQKMKNVIHYQTTSVLSGSQLTELADDVRLSYNNTQLLGRLDNAWALDNISVRRVDVPDLPQLTIAFTSGPIAGTDSTNMPTATQVAMLLTGRAYTTFPRTVRQYIPGWVGTTINQFGEFDTVALGDGLALGERLDVLSVTGDSAERVAVQYTLDPPRVTASNRIEDYETNRIVSALRSRRKGVGS